MAKDRAIYICQSCGAITPRWVGRCEDCGNWNTITEEKRHKARHKAQPAILGDLAADDLTPPQRLQSQMEEFDRALGGGFVAGSIVLVGGEPGIGKSTLMLQVAAQIAQSQNQSAVYISGEEAAEQIRLRAHRLGEGRAPLKLVTETNLNSILALFEQTEPPALLIIDSIQTMWLDGLDAAPGTVTQLRAATQALVHLAKRTGTAIVLIGHVTKDGQIAGPNVIAHMVDGVFHFEGSAGHQFRILRSIKNRYGPADEIGVFEMHNDGLRGVANPSSLFLGSTDGAMSGAAVFAGIEGTRPLLMEVQALATPSVFGQPRRAAVGCDPARLSMLLAVMEARANVSFAGQDVYVNVAGGLRITDPAADLAIVAALLSSSWDIAWPEKTVFFGEISLSGHIRPVLRPDARLKEAKKLGFLSSIAPPDPDKAENITNAAQKIVGNVNELTTYLGSNSESSRKTLKHRQ